MKMRAALLVLGAALSTPAFGTFKTGNMLLRDCSDLTSEVMCVGYITGAADAARLMEPPAFCLPAGVTISQMKLVVTQYLQLHLAELHFDASSLVKAALEQAFPCRK